MTEIEHVDQETPGGQPIQVRLKVTELLKDDHHLGIKGGEFEGPYSWDGVYFEPGERYLVFSNRKDSMATTLELPDETYRVTAADDPIGDLDLILSVISLSTGEQAHAAATAVRSRAAHHSYIFAAYAADLLADSADSGTFELAQALEGPLAAALSDRGARALLANCHIALWMREAKAPDNLAHVFFALMTRYFVGGQGTNSGLTPIQQDVLNKYIGWILEVEPARAAFRSWLSPSTSVQLRRKLTQMVNDGGMDLREKSHAAEFLGLLDAR
jgi:hypothetical protein